MKEFRDRVAVVTGAASGIGRALTQVFAEQGMKIVAADIEEAALDEATRELEKSGTQALPVVTDVTEADQVQALADAALSEFGAIHIACNNAGVFTGGLCWQQPLEDYEWVMGVNLWGVIHGIRTFVPILLEQGGEAHIVNTASMAGVTVLPYAGIYHMTKHAVLSLSECLYHELQTTGSQLRVSALCPEGVATNIDTCERNRPAELDGGPATAEGQLVQKAMVDFVAKGVPPRVLAERTLEAIREERFYILSDDAWRDSANQRAEDIRLGRNPTLSPPV